MASPSTTANTVIFRLFLLAVLWSPLPLGSNRPWSWSLLAVVIGALLTAWSVLVATGHARAPVPARRLLLPAIPFVLVLIWAGLQASALLPAAYWHPIWAEAGKVLAASGGAGPGDMGMITVDPALTWTAILRLACYGAIFWLAVQLGRERSRAHEAGLAFVIASVAYAAYGLILHFAKWEVVLWFPKWAYIGDLTATFINRNAYGAYAGLGTLFCIGLFVHVLRPSRHGRERMAGEVAEAVVLRALPYLLAALICGSALLSTHSRGAFIATAIALVVLLAQLAWAGVMRPRLAAILVAVVVTLGIGIVAVSGDGTLSRLATETSQDHEIGRVSVYRLTGDAIADAPITGHGLGAFLPAFRIYRDITLSWTLIWDYAHNVYLEVAMDLGLPMAVIFGLSFAATVVVCLLGVIRRRRDHVYPAVAVAAAVQLGVHGLVDFGPQTPAVAATFAFLLGIGYAQSWNTTDHRAGAKTPGQTGGSGDRGGGA